MEVTVQLGMAKYEVDISGPLDLSIPVQFQGKQLSVYQAPPATSKPYQAPGFIGSVARGGSCNCDIHTLIPHASGTHTECVGHISDSLISIHETLRDSFLAATLVTLQPEKSSESAETYSSALDRSDLLLTRKSLKAALHQVESYFLDAVVIRTIPNAAEKQTRDYNTGGSPFFSTEAMKYLVERNIRHLLVDTPSVDRLHDEGRLTNHRIFWNVPQGSHHVEKQATSPKTITELIYAPDSIGDGQYLLNLQLAPFVADAAPSRPILYKMRAL